VFSCDFIPDPVNAAPSILAASIAASALESSSSSTAAASVAPSSATSTKFVNFFVIMSSHELCDPKMAKDSLMQKCNGIEMDRKMTLNFMGPSLKNVILLNMQQNAQVENE
jgi:hypothetical protein